MVNFVIMNPSSHSIGKIIVGLRRVHGISQENLAVESGVDRRYLSDLENDKRNPSIEIVAKLAAYFGLSTAQFFAIGKPVTLSKIKELLCEAESDDAVVFESPDYATAFLGIAHDGRAIYDYSFMVASLVAEGMSVDEAVEFIDYNTLRAMPYMGHKAPVILYR